MMPHRLIEEHLLAVENAVEQMSGIQIDRYLEEVLTPNRTNLRIRLRFPNGNLLEVNEALQIESEILILVDYRYHYQNSRNQLIFRYDNTPHFPDLLSFPHHKHLPDQVIACIKPSIIQILQEAASHE